MMPKRTNPTPPPTRAKPWSFALFAMVALFATLGASAPAMAWWNDDWTLRKKITIDTSASGEPMADVAGAAAPVLVRLHAGNFRFASAKEDGSDIRFVAADDKTPLKFQIEKFNPLLNEALVWVSVPDLKAGARTEFWLYYNNRKAPNASDAKGVYDSDTLLVYHFSENGTPPQDSSIWANHATSPGRVADGALIGQGLRLDGSAALGIPDTTSLNLPENSPMTWSAWINMAAPQPNAVLFSHREGGTGFAIGLDDGVPFVEAGNAAQSVRTPAAAPIATDQWHQLAVVADGATIALYLDGNPYASVAGSLPALSGKSLLGGDNAAAPAGGDQPAADATAPPAPAGGFVGDVDELVIAKVARSAGTLKFAAVDQGTNPGKLVTYSDDEETSSWFTGYFAVILKSVTLDGWVVIGLLGIMMVLSWIVMVDKIGYIGRQAKCNARFMEAFHDNASEFATLEPAQPVGDAAEEKAEDAREPLKDSSLLRIYDLGVSELRRRFARRPGEHVLSDQAITAIRAALDTIFIKETQKLNRLMVVLTIAISGGPFLGLLGTVVGVMITFAAIAASGDVNVNAIAPGIAAALVATVAGLAVAIPALFGYNYLTVRIKDLTSDMQVFVDELLARMAEEFQPHAGEPRRQAAE
jgi:biopolymer transport protein ExbB